jgi:hypothetical protein
MKLNNLWIVQLLYFVLTAIFSKKVDLKIEKKCLILIKQFRNCLRKNWRKFENYFESSVSSSFLDKLIETQRINLSNSVLYIRVKSVKESLQRDSSK